MLDCSNPKGLNPISAIIWLCFVSHFLFIWLLRRIPSSVGWIMHIASPIPDIQGICTGIYDAPEPWKISINSMIVIPHGPSLAVAF